MTCFEFWDAASLCRIHYVLLPDLIIRSFGQVIWLEPGKDIGDYLIASPSGRQVTDRGIALPLAANAAAGDALVLAGLSSVSAPGRERFRGRALLSLAVPGCRYMPVCSGALPAVPGRAGMQVCAGMFQGFTCCARLGQDMPIWAGCADPVFMAFEVKKAAGRSRQL